MQCFQVMIQAHNRHSSMSWYLAALAVTDTLILSLGLSLYSLFVKT